MPMPIAAVDSVRAYVMYIRMSEVGQVCEIEIELTYFHYIYLNTVTDNVESPSGESCIPPT